MDHGLGSGPFHPVGVTLGCQEEVGRSISLAGLLLVAGVIRVSLGQAAPLVFLWWPAG